MNNRIRFPYTLLLVATCPALIGAAEVSVAWVVAPVLASGTRLPVLPGYTVNWRADGRALPAGILTNPGPGDRFVRLEGTLMRPGASRVVKRFTVRLLDGTARRLTAYARIRRIHWAADGRPLLDMTRDKEVAAANRRVTMAVTIR